MIRQEYLRINNMRYTYFELNTYKKLLIFFNYCLLSRYTHWYNNFKQSTIICSEFKFSRSVLICIATSIWLTLSVTKRCINRQNLYINTFFNWSWRNATTNWGTLFCWWYAKPFWPPVWTFWWFNGGRYSFEHDI